MLHPCEEEFMVTLVMILYFIHLNFTPSVVERRCFMSGEFADRHHHQSLLKRSGSRTQVSVNCYRSPNVQEDSWSSPCFYTSNIPVQNKSVVVLTSFRVIKSKSNIWQTRTISCSLGSTFAIIRMSWDEQRLKWKVAVSASSASVAAPCNRGGLTALECWTTGSSIHGVLDDFGGTQWPGGRWSAACYVLAMAGWQGGKLAREKEVEDK